MRGSGKGGREGVQVNGRRKKEIEREQGGDSNNIEIKGGKMEQ